MLVPFERVFPVPGLSVQAEDGGPGDAVELFLGRAAAGGAPSAPTTTRRIAAICRALDGMALAIELAAARFASLGLDGLEAGLADRLQAAHRRPRVDDRHRSLRSTLDWSYALLDGPDQAVLRRVSVFAGPFTGDGRGGLLADWPPVPAAPVPTILAGLADQSLLVAIAGPVGTRYRALETIRQYGVERLDEAGESAEARSRHLRWCLAESEALEPRALATRPGWRAAFDQVADELRGALAWAARSPEQRAGGVPVGDRSGRPMLHSAACPASRSAATNRRPSWPPTIWPPPTPAQRRGRRGVAALRRRRVAAAPGAADAALRAGDRAGAAADLAHNAELINRGPGHHGDRACGRRGGGTDRRGMGAGRR